MCYNRFTLYEDGLILIVMLLYFAKHCQLFQFFMMLQVLDWNYGSPILSLQYFGIQLMHL